MMIKPGMAFKTAVGGYFQYFLGEDHDLRKLYCGQSRHSIKEYRHNVYTKVSYLHLEFPESIFGGLWYKPIIEYKRWKRITKEHYEFSRRQFAINEVEASAVTQSQNEDFSVETTD